MTSPLLIAAATALTLLLSESFELVRVSTFGSYKVAYSTVRVLDAKKATIVETRTDRYGRVKFDLPAGTYNAEATDGKRIFRFTITIPAKESRSPGSN